MKILVQNKKAYHDYFIEDTYEAGLELFGTEVKSIRAGKCSIRESYIEIKNGEAFVVGMNVSPYEMGNIFNRDPLRKRRLLLHRREIRALLEAKTKDGYTLVPTKVYLNDRGYVKIEVAVAKGKKLYDKRESIQKRDVERKIQKEIKKFK